MAREKCCCCKCDKHIAISIVGLSLSFWELILASVYNFHTIGLAMAIIGIVTSGLYLHLTLKDFKARSESEASQSHQLGESEDT